jgi:hypothetical protein
MFGQRWPEDEMQDAQVICLQLLRSTALRAAFAHYRLTSLMLCSRHAMETDNKVQGNVKKSKLN